MVFRNCKHACCIAAFVMILLGLSGCADTAGQANNRQSVYNAIKNIQSDPHTIPDRGMF